MYGGIVVYKKEDDVVVKTNEQREQFVLPNEFRNTHKFSVIIPQVKKEEPSKEGEGENSAKDKGGEDEKRKLASSPEEPKPDLATLLMKANYFYHQKKYKKLLSVLNKAENFYPKASRVKTMKGSLFYSLGWKDLANEQWTNSLNIQPNQPAVRKYMQKLYVPSASSAKIPSSESFGSTSSESFDSTEIKESIEKLQDNIEEKEKEEELLQ